jgi:hypothetical protein
MDRVLACLYVNAIFIKSYYRFELLFYCYEEAIDRRIVPEFEYVIELYREGALFIQDVSPLTQGELLYNMRLQHFASSF